MSVTAAEERWQIGIEVRDNGIGIAPEHRKRVFKLFERLDARASGGSGVGLAICRRIVSSHGGSIVLDSTPGAGSTFTVRLPGQA